MPLCFGPTVFPVVRGDRIPVWERRAKTIDIRKTIWSFITTLKTVWGTPARFFADMTVSGDYQEPLLFLTICYFIGGILSAETGGKIVDLIGFPVLGILSAIIASSIMNYIQGRFFEAGGSFEGVFRIVSYGSSVILFTFIPHIRTIAALYGLYLILTGMKELLRMTTGKAFVTILFTFLAMNLIRFLIPWIITSSPFGLFIG